MTTSAELAFRTGIATLTALFVLIIFPHDGRAQVRLTDGLALYGDARFGYFGQHRNERDGSDVERHELRLRARLGLAWAITEGVQVRIRYAGRFSSIDPEFHPGWTTTAAGNNGLRLGELAFDEAYVRYDYARGSHMKAGRFTTGYTLPGVISNAIIRNDAPNTDIQWTDGILISQRLPHAWRVDLITQVHVGNPPTNTARSPLDLGADQSRVTLFTSLTRTQAAARVRLLGVDATFSPNAIASHPDDRDHYAAVSAKVALGWPTDRVGDVVWGFESAWSLVRPYASQMRIGGDGRVGGLGFQSVLSFMSFVPGHSVGFAVAVIEPALLTSEDYWNNSTLAEVRYSLRLSTNLSAQARVRYRADLNQLSTAERRRAEFVTYARLTYRL
jgi:hypothetical protein